MKSYQPFTTTVVGSMPKFPWLYRPKTAEELKEDYKYGERGVWTFDGQLRNIAINDAIRVSIRLQEKAAINIISDGEQRREHYLTHFTKKMSGFDYSRLAEKIIRGGTKAMVGRCVAPIEHVAPITIDDLSFLKKEVDQPVKITLPGPMTIVDSTHDEYYFDEKSMAEDWAIAINREAKLLDKLGPEIIQFDEPAFSRYPEKVSEWGIEMLQLAAADLNANTAVHICYGSPHPEKKRSIVDSYPRLISILEDCDIDILALEFEGARLDPKLLSKCPSKRVMFGCVWNSDQRIETADYVAERLLRAADILSPEQIMPAPDCGLSPCSFEIAEKKLRILSEGTKIARERSK